MRRNKWNNIYNNCNIAINTNSLCHTICMYQWYLSTFSIIICRLFTILQVIPIMGYVAIYCKILNIFQYIVTQLITCSWKVNVDRLCQTGDPHWLLHLKKILNGNSVVRRTYSPMINAPQFAAANIIWCYALPRALDHRQFLRYKRCTSEADRLSLMNSVL